METRVHIIDEKGREQNVCLVSGTSIKGIRLYPYNPLHGWRKR